jgi:hypothetical protein
MGVPGKARVRGGVSMVNSWWVHGGFVVRRTGFVDDEKHATFFKFIFIACDSPFGLTSDPNGIIFGSDDYPSE